MILEMMVEDEMKDDFRGGILGMLVLGMLGLVMLSYMRYFVCITWVFGFRSYRIVEVGEIIYEIKRDLGKVYSRRNR